MDGAAREEDEPRHARLERRPEPLQGAREVRAQKGIGSAVMASAPRAGAFPLHGRVDHGVRAPDQFPDGLLDSQRPGARRWYRRTLRGRSGHCQADTSGGADTQRARGDAPGSGRGSPLHP
jgi:hypothetical protein